MTFLTALVGGSMGFMAQVMSNGIRKVPLSRRTLLFLLACSIGNALFLCLY